MRNFERYRPIIDDWDNFVEASRCPLPICIWANPRRIAPDCLAARLRTEALTVQEIGWNPLAFRVSPGSGIGRRLEYLAGLYQVQEEVAMLPAFLLRPEPGEFVLDLCAAPGNKTAQMALMMAGRGTVIANEVNGNRMQPLRQAINRLGLANVTTTVSDATAFPKQSRPFDRIMADVVCSCEGTCRKNPDVLDMDVKLHAERISRTQVAILTRALQLCKPGGRIVYATCTYAPEENEMVVQAALDAVSPKIAARIVAGEMPGWRWSPGLKKWQGAQFRSDMENAIRIYPHQNDTGGFFIALIEKTDDLRRPGAQVKEVTNVYTSARVKPVDSAPLFEFIETRFGIKRAIFSEYEIFRTNSKEASLRNRDHFPMAHPAPHTVGLPFIHINMKYPKLTTAAVMAFGQHASKHVLNVSHEQKSAFLRGEVFQAALDQVSNFAEEGYVVIKYDDIFLGLGILYLREDGTEVYGQFPKAWQVQ